MNIIRLKLLLSKYIDNTISKSELSEFLLELEANNLDEISSLLDFKVETIVDDNLLFEKDKVFRKLKEQLKVKKNHKVLIFSHLRRIAAALILLIGIYTIQFVPVKYNEDRQGEDIVLSINNNATITLADGKKLPLLYTDKKILSKEGIELIHDIEGEVAFRVTPTKEKDIVYRTFNTAKGMPTKLILSDGTVVLLNSSTNLSYPSRFSNTQRSILLDGEGYFEVKHDDRVPFVISTNNINVKVLGTTFNIATNILSNKVLTTLVSGVVEVNTTKAKKIIKPGQQSITDNLSGELTCKEVVVQDILSWKEGYFRFNEDNISTVLDKIKSWYEIDGYEIHSVSIDRFSGSIRRSYKLTDLLKQLEKISNYKFKIVERRVIVMS